MLVEARLLELGVEGFQKEIIRLKKEEIKTEPTFCKVLGAEKVKMTLLSGSKIRG